MHDILDVIKNLQTLCENNSAFKVLKDFERVIDELDIYVFNNWDEGELVEGPIIERHWVKCSFMWDRKEMPDPEGAKRLHSYGCDVVYKKENILIPRKIEDPDDFRPGTKKGKIDAHPVWVVTISMPKKLMQDVSLGKNNRDHSQMAELLKYSDTQQPVSAEETAQESPTDVQM